MTIEDNRLRRWDDVDHGERRPIDRLRNELDLAILTIIGGVSAVVLVGFAVYRFMTGAMLGGYMDVGISVGLAAIVVYAWRTIDVARAGAIFVAFAMVACIVSSFVFGGTATYWTFLVLSVSFIVAGPRTALTCGIILIIAIASRSEVFADPAEQAIFAVTGALVAIFAWIFNVRYNVQRRRLEELALSDALTQAGNRRAMRRALIATVAQGRAQTTPAVLAVMDLDHFKAVNDQHGHEKGDQVLIDFAEIVRDRLRRGDGFFRLGGEEFVVLLPGTTLDQGRPVVEEIHRRVDDGMREIGIPVTVSIGVAELHTGDDWSSWLRRGDNAMYRAKDAGRNRVVIDSEPVPEGEGRAADRRHDP